MSFNNSIYQGSHLFNSVSIKRYREELNLNQKKFAGQVGISTVTLSKLENGKIAFSDFVKKSIEKHFISTQKGWENTDNGERFDSLLFANISFLRLEGKRKLWEYISNLMLDDKYAKNASVNFSIKTSV